eukprot:scaffold14921_cov12-Tisochrysis_lutea.AAC.1
MVEQPKLPNRLAVILHTILLGAGGTCYNEHIKDQPQNFDLDYQQASKLARKIHANSVKYAYKNVTTRRAIVNRNTPHSQ